MRASNAYIWSKSAQSEYEQKNMKQLGALRWKALTTPTDGAEFTAGYCKRFYKAWYFSDGSTGRASWQKDMKWNGHYGLENRLSCYGNDGIIVPFHRIAQEKVSRFLVHKL
jgi:hypothetical protein